MPCVIASTCQHMPLGNVVVYPCHSCHQRKISLQTSELRTNGHEVVFTPSCPPHHQVVGGRETVDHSSSPGACELAGETMEARKSVCFCRPGVARVWPVFPRFRASIWKSCRQNVPETAARACLSKILPKSWGVRNTCGRWGRKKMVETVATARSP